jgi:hypothetical protein
MLRQKRYRDTSRISEQEQEQKRQTITLTSDTTQDWIVILTNDWFLENYGHDIFITLLYLNHGAREFVLTHITRDTLRFQKEAQGFYKTLMEYRNCTLLSCTPNISQMDMKQLCTSVATIVKVAVTLEPRVKNSNHSRTHSHSNSGSHYLTRGTTTSEPLRTLIQLQLRKSVILHEPLTDWISWAMDKRILSYTESIETHTPLIYALRTITSNNAVMLFAFAKYCPLITLQKWLDYQPLIGRPVSKTYRDDLWLYAAQLAAIHRNPDITVFQTCFTRGSSNHTNAPLRDFLWNLFQSGNISCITWVLDEIKIPFDFTMQDVMNYPKLAYVLWRYNGQNIIVQKRDTLTRLAEEDENLSTIQFLIKHNWPVNRQMIRNAFKNRAFRIVEWALTESWGKSFISFGHHLWHDSIGRVTWQLDFDWLLAHHISFMDDGSSQQRIRDRYDDTDINTRYRVLKSRQYEPDHLFIVVIFHKRSNLFAQLTWFLDNGLKFTPKVLCAIIKKQTSHEEEEEEVNRQEPNLNRLSNLLNWWFDNRHPTSPLNYKVACNLNSMMVIRLHTYGVPWPQNGDLFTHCIASHYGYLDDSSDDDHHDGDDDGEQRYKIIARFALDNNCPIGPYSIEALQSWINDDIKPDEYKCQQRLWI